MSNEHQLEAICLENIDQGAALEQFNELIVQAVRDIADRPDRGGDRKVTLTVTIKPDEEAEPGMNNPTIAYKAKVDTPGIEGRTTRGLLDGRTLKVNRAFRAEPNQTNIAGIDQRRQSTNG